ncbi:flagellar biosynthesis protein FlhF [Anaerosinus massiliensis]|uniref:flagellar biosynthesis protein FlhF n=1 Tax=Massilibacillus massiliensis TaxID=1806837 RepID=UPI000A52B8B7|nr:flagellar biosynthesis protein FlhF [Massilibacillus massiliensis]
MKIKVFTASSMQEAMGQVKSELGIDAVILHTRRFHKGGIFGYMGKEMIEVTAAVEDKPQMPVVPKSSPVIPEVILPKNIVKQYTNAGSQQLPANPILSDNDITNVKEEAADVSIETTNFVENLERNSKEKTLENDITSKDDKIVQLQQELDHMKKMLEQVISSVPQNKVETMSLFDALTENEVDGKIAEEIVTNILDEAVLNNKDMPETADFLADYFEQAMRPALGIEIHEDRTKIVALIGATGVGKTTTIAKIAANFVLDKACSVALITADTYRISAVEQLKTYSDIIGIPLEIVYSPDELKVAIDKHRDKQLVLIDTAGRSQHNDFQLEELKCLLEVNADIEKHLVLSATTKYKDAVDILRKFSVCEPDKVLFTKVDETSTVGAIINLVYQYPITLSYITNGQSVPDDIVLADSKELAKLLLR